MKKTITVDLDVVAKRVRDVALSGGGLESSSGYTPDDLDRVVNDVIVMCPELEGFMDLLNEIIGIHIDAHDDNSGLYDDSGELH